MLVSKSKRCNHVPSALQSFSALPYPFLSPRLSQPHLLRVFQCADPAYTLIPAWCSDGTPEMLPKTKIHTRNGYVRHRVSKKIHTVVNGHSANTIYTACSCVVKSGSDGIYKIRIQYSPNKYYDSVTGPWREQGRTNKSQQL